MALPTLSMEEAKKLAAGPYARTMLENLATYVTPISWTIRVENDALKLTNGTAFFVKTPRATFGVTARHVVAGFLAAKTANSRTICHLLDTELDLASAVISQGSTADIATFRVSDTVIAKLGKQPITGWPPMMPQPDKGIMYAGFPGAERLQVARREFSFGLYFASNVAHSIDHEKITTMVDRESIVDTIGCGLPPECYDVGGMSGGPLLTMVETCVISWRLAGVITDGLAMGDILYATRADCISDDGIVTR
jgi:hypothetical protein